MRRIIGYWLDITAAEAARIVEIDVSSLTWNDPHLVLAEKPRAPFVCGEPTRSKFTRTGEGQEDDPLPQVCGEPTRSKFTRTRWHSSVLPCGH